MHIQFIKKRDILKPNADQKELISTIVNECLSVRVRLLSRMVGSVFDQALRPHGVKATQLAILAAVSMLDNPTSKQLSQLLHMDPSTFSRTLTILKKNHWLEAEPSGEGKILMIQITQKGIDLLEAAYPAWQEAQGKAKELLGQSTADHVLSTGTQHLFSGMTK